MASAKIYFSPDYESARSRFRGAARRAGYALASYPIGQRARDGDELSIDVASRGPAAASRALVISSGLHGVEGFFGSAVQLAWLDAQASAALAPGQTLEESGRLFAARRSAPRAPGDELRVVLIHALNPYGFAWRRRVDAGGIDLNRNFLLAGQAFTGAPAAYRELDPLLNPDSPPRPLDPFLLQALFTVAQHGFRALKNAVVQGQYEFPRGLFYGGAAPSATQQLLREQMPAWLGRPERVLHLDLHTGRGAFARYILGIDLPSESARLARLRRAFGPRTIEGFDADGVLYEVRGGLGRWLEQLFPQTQYDCLLAEFGTYGGLEVLAALREENRAHHYAAGDARALERARAQLFDAFCPSTDSWRARVLPRALRLIDQALAELG